MSHSRLFPAATIGKFTDSPYVLGRCQQQAERARGSRIVMMSQPGATPKLRPGESARLFTNDMSGCVGIGYVSLLATGERAPYLRHAAYWSVIDQSVTVPAPFGKIVDARAVLAARSYDPLEPFTADHPGIPYEAMTTLWYLAPLIDDLVRITGDPAKVTIAPYHESSQGPYNRSLLVDVLPEDRLGVMIADGRHVIE